MPSVVAAATGVPADSGMTVAVIGLGYIGLSTAAALADGGVTVLGVDIDPERVAAVASGTVTTDEADLTRLVRRACETGRLGASATPGPADAFVIAVPTPLAPDFTAELGHVFDAADAIAPFLRPGNLVILESTVPIGTTRRLAAHLAGWRPDLRFSGGDGAAVDVHVAHCPERVFPGRTVDEIRHNARVVGGLTAPSAAQARELYARFSSGPIAECSAETAEAVKLVENSFRDVNIAFANELAGICAVQGIDALEVIGLANQHPRVSVLRPGIGVGGHCIPIDPWFLMQGAPGHHRLLSAARAVNAARPAAILDRVREAITVLDPAGRGLTLLCYGLGYKADTSDVRESPAVEIVAHLAADPRLRIAVVDPFVARLPAPLAALGSVSLFPDIPAEAPDLALVLVPHSGAADALRRLDRDVPVLDPASLLPPGWRAPSGAGA